MHRDHDNSPGNGGTSHPGLTPASPGTRPLRIGIGGPVGSGKTALVAALCRALSGQVSLAVVTNDIYTTEDADFLRAAGVLSADRIAAVQTGCCPHTAVRDDISGNLDAVEDLEAAHADLDLVVIESGGDNLTMTFSRGLADVQLFVIDVSGGDKVPRKGGPGVTRSDLLVINKTDLAPLVGADLGVMDRDAARMRPGTPVVFLSLRGEAGAAPVTGWVLAQLAAWQSGTAVPVPVPVQVSVVAAGDAPAGVPGGAVGVASASGAVSGAGPTPAAG